MLAVGGPGAAGVQLASLHPRGCEAGTGRPHVRGGPCPSWTQLSGWAQKTPAFPVTCVSSSEKPLCHQSPWVLRDRQQSPRIRHVFPEGRDLRNLHAVKLLQPLSQAKENSEGRRGRLAPGPSYTTRIQSRKHASPRQTLTPQLRMASPTAPWEDGRGASEEGLSCQKGVKPI